MTKLSLGVSPALALLLALPLAGCMAQSDDGVPPETVGEDESAIIGGTPTTGDPAIVALLAKDPSKEGASLCTAEIVSPTVVLTAAHCVDPALVGANATYQVRLAADLTNKDNPGVALAVKSVDWDRQFDKNDLQNGHDIAVAILQEPTTIKPLPVNRGALPSSLRNSNVRIVGYGLNNGFAQTGAGIKRTATTKLTSFDAKFVVTGTNRARICSGDSGGPVLATLNGVETIVGVNSFGFIFCLGTSSSTRPDAYNAFLDKYLPR
jgi:secreted trypsin-like serine protease